MIKKQKRKTEKVQLQKNELLQQMIAQAIYNQLVFKYVIADSWFGSTSLRIGEVSSFIPHVNLHPGNFSHQQPIQNQ